MVARRNTTKFWPLKKYAALFDSHTSLASRKLNGQEQSWLLPRAGRKTKLKLVFNPTKNPEFVKYTFPKIFSGVLHSGSGWLAEGEIPGIMPFANFQGGDSALRCPRRRAQRQAMERRKICHVHSILPDGNAAARRP
jgi:hypothetical protein